jgi:hypothetical protein
MGITSVDLYSIQLRPPRPKTHSLRVVFYVVFRKCRFFIAFLVSTPLLDQCCVFVTGYIPSNHSQILPVDSHNERR